MISTRFCPVCGAANGEAEQQCFACGHALPENGQDEHSGQQVLLHGRYRLGNMLGSGGYSAVYRAWDTQEGGRPVAIKQITLHGLGAEEAIEATNTYNREVEALSSLDHSQVPDLYDHFSDPDHWYLVLEYIEGQTLEDYIEDRETQRKPFDLDEVLRIALQLCNVLTYLHARHPPVIFRDLKPDNIMRTPTGQLYLIDFGIARHYIPGQSRDTQSLGSPGYAAPEQYGRAQTDVRTDLYGLGALLHQLLSGHDPSETPRALPTLRLNGQPGSVEMERLVARLLADNPLDRPANAHEVARELGHIRQLRASIVQGKPIWQPPVPQNYPVASGSPLQMQFQQQASQVRKQRLNRRKLLVGLGVSAVLLGGGFEAYNLYASAHTPVPIASVHVFTGPTQTIYANHTNTINALAWSPDSQRIASASADQTMQIWDALSGNEIHMYNGANAQINAVAWSTDGSQLLFGGTDGVVWNIPLASFGPVQSISEHVDLGSVEALAWAPGANPGLFAVSSEYGMVLIWDPKGGKPVELRYQLGLIINLAYSTDGWFLSTGAQDHTIVTWDTSSYKRVYVTYRGHTDAITSLLWIPNSAYIVSASADQTVQIWDATNGGRAVLYQKHDAKVNAVAVSPDGSYVASASDDASVRVWNTYDGSDVLVYQGHSAAVKCVAWSPDGKYIASGSEDKTVHVWNAPAPPSD